MFKTLPFALLLFTLGCETGGPPAGAPPVTTETTFNAPRATVWPILVAEIGLNYPVVTMDKDSGFMTTDFVTLPVGFNNARMKAFVYPPATFAPTWDGLRVKISAQATDAPEGKTHVVINAHFEAFENNVSKSWLVCQSNGNLEWGVFARMRQKLQNPAAQ
jgi:hypothetical protein